MNETKVSKLPSNGIVNVQSISLIGRRPTNEDQHQVILNMDQSDKSLSAINFFSIYDGHGGNQVSKYLKNNLYHYYMDLKKEYPLSEKYVARVCNHLQTKLKLYDKEMALNTGSTCLVILQYNKNNKQYLQIMNTGDCRAILSKNNIAMTLTKDHKPNWPEEKIRIEKLGGVIKKDGQDYRICDLSVSRAFGDIKATPYVTHLPDVYKYILDNSVQFIVVACDGLWDVMSGQDVVNFVLQNRKEDKRRNIAKNLAEYALKIGSFDNITVVIIFFQ